MKGGGTECVVVAPSCEEVVNGMSGEVVLLLVVTAAVDSSGMGDVPTEATLPVLLTRMEPPSRCSDEQ